MTGGDFVALDEIADVRSGATPSKSRPEYWDGDIPWVSAKDMKSRRLRDAEDHISVAGLDSGSRLAPPDATLVLIRGMTLLSDVPICRLERDMAFNQDVKAIVPKDTVDPAYLTYALLAAKPELMSMVELAGHGTGRLPTDRLKALEIRLPAKPEQRAIARILGRLDDKIELNRRMNETLEAIARAVFKSWFVDFDPVRAKAEGRDPGLPSHLADLFPDHFEDSELGEVPKGWEIAPLGDHIDAVKGVSYKGSGLSDSGMPLHNLNSIYEGGGYKYDGIKYYEGAFADRHVVHPGDLIVANTEQGHHHLLIGYAAIVPGLLGDSGAISHHIYRLDLLSSSPLTRSFIYHLINSGRMHQVISGYSNGTSINMLPSAGLQKPKFVVPPYELINMFSGLADTVLKKCEESVAENQTLAALRDTLLPKLISGEVRVSVEAKH